MSRNRVGGVGTRRGIGTGEKGGVVIGGGTGGDGSPTDMGFIETRNLNDGDYAAARTHVPSGYEVKIFALGSQTASNTSPSGLTSRVEDETNSSVITSTGQKSNNGNPIASRSSADAGGPFDVAFIVENGTGNPQDVAGFFVWAVTQT